MAVVAAERASEKNINLHFPSLFESALIGTRMRTETMEGKAMSRPSWTVVAPTSTMYKGRKGRVTADPSIKRNETTTTPYSNLYPVGRRIADWIINLRFKLILNA